MSDPRPTLLARPTVGVHFGYYVFVYLWDAVRFPNADVEAKGFPPDARKVPEGAVMLMSHKIYGLPGLSLDALYPGADGATVFGSTYDDSERWYVLDLIVEMTRAGDLVTFATAIAPEGTNRVSPDDRVGYVQCDADALADALDVARRWFERAAHIVASASDAPADAPWADWAAHPNLAIRRRVLKGTNLPQDVLESLADDPDLIDDVVWRKDAPAHVLARIHADANVRGGTLVRMAEHPNTPSHVLEDIERAGAGSFEYSDLFKASTRARALLAERAIANASGLDEIFGELRAALDVTPSTEAWSMLLRTLRAGLAVDPAQFAEVWVPYTRERMDGWRPFDCSLPRADVDAWLAGARPTPLLGACKRLAIDTSNATPDTAAWERLVASPFTAGLHTLGYFQCPTRDALDALARLDLPAIREVYATGFGDTAEPLDHDPLELTAASWLGHAHEFTMSHVAHGTEFASRFVSSAPKLTRFGLRHGASDATLASAFERSGAHASLLYLELADGDYASSIANLCALDLPELRHFSADRTGLTQADFTAICASPWIRHLEDLHLEGNPGIIDLSPLIAVLDTLKPTVTLLLEHHGAPTAQVEAIQESLPETARLDVGH